MSKKIDVTLIPRYEEKRAIQYERIWSTIHKTICKTRLYKFIRVAYSRPYVPESELLERIISQIWDSLTQMRR